MDSALITYFCKKGKHPDCPGEWPIGDSDGNDDCSFNVIIKRCACECHRT